MVFLSATRSLFTQLTGGKANVATPVTSGEKKGGFSSSVVSPSSLTLAVVMVSQKRNAAAG